MSKARGRLKQADKRKKLRRRRTSRLSGPPVSQPDGPGQLVLDPKQLMHLYLTGRYDDLSETFLRLLGEVLERGTDRYTAASPDFIDLLLGNLFYFFARSDYVISDKYAKRFITQSVAIANLAAASSFGTTDPQVRMLMKQPGNLFKLLTLLSPRNRIPIDRKKIFDADPQCASRWYSVCYFATRLRQDVHDNLREHAAYVDDRYEPGPAVAGLPYFHITYIAPDLQRPLRRKINSVVRRQVQDIRIVNTPRHNSIAVATGKWYPDNVVYRCLYPLVAPLADDYDLTLINFDPSRSDLDTGLFSRVHHVSLKDEASMRAAMQAAVGRNDFQLVFFADVGMTRESIYMSNLRIAPIQVTGYGHPVSGFGTEVDYFIGGADVEVASLAGENYDERLVLIPGIGAAPVHPTYERTDRYRPNDPIVVNCPWTPQKISYELLSALREAADRTQRKVVFRVFAGSALEDTGGLQAFMRELTEVLGPDGVQVARKIPADVYMAEMEKGDFSLDAYPFGGYNTIIDSLYLGKPVITWEGNQFYNRCASAVLRKVALEELIATSRDEYVGKIVRLLDDEAYRDDLHRRVAETDLDALIFQSAEHGYFKKAIDFLIANHDRLTTEKSREPVFIT